MDAWNKLSFRERGKHIREQYNNGNIGILKIRADYNKKFAEGGDTSEVDRTGMPFVNTNPYDESLYRNIEDNLKTSVSNPRKYSNISTTISKSTNDKKVDFKIPFDYSQKADAITNNNGNSNSGNIQPIKMSNQQYYKMLQERSKPGSITPLTPQQKQKMEDDRSREWWTSDMYANERINAAKKGISGVTAVTSYIPGPIGVASKYINLGIDAIDTASGWIESGSPSPYNSANVISGTAKAWGLTDAYSRPGLSPRKVAALKGLDVIADAVGSYDTADDITGGKVSETVEHGVKYIKDKKSK